MLPRVPSSSVVLGLSCLIPFLQQLEEADGAVISSHKCEIAQGQPARQSHFMTCRQVPGAESTVLSPDLGLLLIPSCKRLESNV